MNISPADLRQHLAQRNQAWRNGPAFRSTKRSKRQPWTTHEDATLRQMAGTHTSLQIAATLGRTEGAVKARAVTLDIVLPRAFSGARRSVGGKRESLGGLYVRSSAEQRYASYLNFLKERGEIASWAYEAHTFSFVRVTRGTRDYTPDFRVEYPDGHHEWLEVKGYMDPKSATRLKRMAKYFPNEVVRVIDSAWFAEARRSGLAGLVPGWERGEKR